VTVTSGSLFLLLQKQRISNELSRNVLSNFWALPEFLSGSKNNLAKRFNCMIREYVTTDPRYQTGLDIYNNK